MDLDCTGLRWSNGSSMWCVVLFGRGKVGVAFRRAMFFSP